ncbi:hypothetical protein H2200_013385 [Cladophialophora chaetospira]|uniref:Indoleamine 2,3-dioxygenase n=1 Tax=Cladophialophora chaetospira TaxID=386627 RepID=A0AA38U8X8_9EURO|nr:hypothetical protein H2200_013385 [Cladophialophora chaetospira]
MRQRPVGILRRCRVSASSGFLPEPVPIKRLPDPYYEPWETTAASLPRLIQNDQARARIDDLPVLDTERLIGEEEWRRAYSILAFLTHAYIWSGEMPSDRLPPQLTCPFLSVSEHFGLPPIATFAALSLWNFQLDSGSSDASNPENLKSILSFTGTKSEEWFYMISTAIEAKAAPLILTMLHCIEAVDAGDNGTVLFCLQTLTNGIREVGKLLQRMHEKCDPQIFYHNVRPLCAGTKGMGAAGLPRGVFYDEGDGQGQWRQYSGGSNAQSSLIQLFDIFLSVDHSATGGSELSPRVSAKSKGYLKEMRDYMPASHREFLLHVERLSNVRAFVSNGSASIDVVEAYNDAVTALASLRNVHIQIVARYIVMPSKSAPAPHVLTRKGKNLATACSDQGVERTDGNASVTRQLHGTGGTSVMPFLKRTRDETRDAVIS